jgi:hypothetical protein
MGMTIMDMNLEPDVADKARQLEMLAANVVFTSGRRTIQSQASAMAANETESPGYIKATYAESDAKEALLAWLANNPGSDQTTMTQGFIDVLNGLTPDQQVKISRHLTGRAFDIQPGSATEDQVNSLNPQLFLTTEGGLSRWHVQF